MKETCVEPCCFVDGCTELRGKFQIVTSFVQHFVNLCNFISIIGVSLDIIVFIILHVPPLLFDHKITKRNKQFITRRLSVHVYFNKGTK